MPTPVVAIVGARAFRADLKKLATDQSGPMFAAMREAGRAAVQPVVAETRSRIKPSGRADTRWHKTDELVNSVRATATRTGATVWMGPRGRRYAGWVEFGGTRHRPHESKREFKKSGRYLFPSARDLSRRAADLYAAGIQKAFDNYHWTNTGTNAESASD
jgi:hypothetical protein